ncbi:MAG: hypothetical protein Q8K75_08850 [Chlamydiales bacterium]|nr:hypothetical protein [Chlamydiales bacterium]
MLDHEGLPHISPIFHLPEGGDHDDHYLRAIRSVLKKIVPENFFRDMQAAGLTLEERTKLLGEQLPLMTCSPLHEPPTNISFSLLARLRSKTCRFFFEMITSWLVPGTGLNNVLFMAADFRMPQFGGQQVYTMCQMIMRVEDPEELEQIRRNLPIIETEILVGVRSAYHARRILEVKGWTADQQTAEIHDRIAHLTSRLPNTFDNDVFTEMQHVLVMCPDEFKAARECRHLSRLISIFYLYRRSLQHAVKRSPTKRHLMLKLYKVRIKDINGVSRFRLALILGISFLRDKEVLEERHLIRAVRKHFHKARAIEGSFLANKRGSENIATLYLELDKGDGCEWTLEELKRLEKQLPNDLKDRIEHPMHPVFNPRNEEEIMRNILTLGNQIKYVRDLPQLHVSFDEQSYAHLYFTVIMARVLAQGSMPVKDMFQQAGSNLEYIHDRCRRIGMLRRKYPKEATVFRVKLAKEDFLRDDHSIDIYKARQTVVAEVARVVGEVRDYNGGMITKQNELLRSVRAMLHKDGQVNNFLLENFFYSLAPVIMRSVMEPAALRKLYLMLVEAFDTGFLPNESITYLLREDSEFLYVVVIADDPSLRGILDDAIEGLDIAPTSLATTYVTYRDTPGIGYIYRCDSVQRRTAFQDVIKSTLQAVPVE